MNIIFDVLNEFVYFFCIVNKSTNENYDYGTRKKRNRKRCKKFILVSLSFVIIVRGVETKMLILSQLYDHVLCI